MEVVDIWNTGCDIGSLILGLDILDSDLSDTGDSEPSSRPMEAGEAESPDMSRVRLETSALVSD